jgi:hypothetical protein
MRASKREIILDGFSAMLLSEDMVDLKRQRESKLRDQAILAAISSADPDPPDEFPIH